MGKGRVIAALAAVMLVCAAGPAAARAYVVVRAATIAPLPVIVYPVVRVDRQWVPGHWEWNGEGHAWVAGHWQLPPRAYSYAD